MLADEVFWDTAGVAEKYGSSLRTYFSRRASKDDAEDLVQEVFLKLQLSKSAKPVTNVEGYLFATARNVLIDYIRANKVSKSASHDVWSDTIGGADPLSPERIAIGQQEYQRVLQAIVNLPPRARQAFELHRFEHLTYQAIGDRMGINKDSVKDLMHRALLRIAEELKALQ
jgi:RNA polymerase sigma factor (sigma-70 family)